MDDAVALALENNLDIAIARYNLNIADTDVWRAKAGSTILGVNSGVVQNTPAAASADWADRSVRAREEPRSPPVAPGPVRRTGRFHSRQRPAITSFDPILTGTFQVDHNISLSSTFSPSSPIKHYHREAFRISRDSRGALIWRWALTTHARHCGRAF